MIRKAILRGLWLVAFFGLVVLTAGVGLAQGTRANPLQINVARVGRLRGLHF